MGFKGSKKKILTATLGSFLLFQQPLMTVVEAAELSDNKHKTEKVTKHETKAKSVKQTEESQTQNKETKESTTESTPKPEQPTKSRLKIAQEIVLKNVQH